MATEVNSVILVGDYHTGQTFEYNNEVHTIVGYYYGDNRKHTMYTITYSFDTDFNGMMLAHKWDEFDTYVWVHKTNTLAANGKTVADIVHAELKDA